MRYLVLPLLLIFFLFSFSLKAEVITDQILFKTASRILEQEGYVVTHLEISPAAHPFRFFSKGGKAILGRGKLYWKMEFDEMSKKVPVHYSCLLSKEQKASERVYVSSCELEIRNGYGMSDEVEIASGEMILN